MKNQPTPSSEPASGRVYWRSLDELSEKPEFRQWIEREFPAGASEFTDPVSRRNFVKIMSASFMLAGLGLGATGCRRPEDKILPFGKAVENYTHGLPQFYATAMPTRYGAVPLLAKSHEGRPIKVEGNSSFPDGNGGTDRFTQASILNLYDPDRAMRFANAANSVSPQAALDQLGVLAKSFQATGGQGVAFLAEPGTSPSRRRLQATISRKLPKAKWFTFDPVDHGIHGRAASQVFGKPVRPVFRYDAAKVVLSLDCDFIGSEEDAHNNIRRFTKGRKIEKPTDSMNRLYVAESLFTLTGINADHRLRLSAGAVVQLAAAIAAEVTRAKGGDVSAFERIGKPAGVAEAWITECAKDLVANSGAALVVAGYRQPLAVHLIANAINAALGAVGKTVELFDAPAPSAAEGTIAELAQTLKDGQADTLIILGSNPAYNAPADLDWVAIQSKVKTVVRLGYYEDETAWAGCHWHYPLAHYLESWGDAIASDGTLVAVQPLVTPLFGGITELEFLARLAGEEVVSGYEIVRTTFAGLSGSGDVEAAWRKFLFNGFLDGSAGKAISATANTAALATALGTVKADVPTAEKLEVVLHRDYSVDDGRFCNNGWLQEMPDPITKITWDNAVLVSRKTARALDVKNGDVVEVTVGAHSIKGPIWTQPGMADFSLGMALGYGRPKVGRIGENVGFSAYPLKTAASGYIVAGATLKKTADTYTFSCTQEHWSMEGRAIVREANLEQFKKEPAFAEGMNAPESPNEQPIYPNPFDEAKKSAHHQWGMSIDLSSCVGCNTCMMACQSENNIPIVGKDLVGRGREMHWLRIDRYYSSKPKTRTKWDVYSNDNRQQFDEWIDEVQAVFQPMLCQHCEAAPCESVCPVNATVHDQEGLNVMVYNRCVGTRYCSNNCPYKVRRFNYLDYNKRSLKELKGPRYPSPLVHSTDGEWDMSRWWKDQNAGMRPEDEWDLIRLLKNPDVTVRMRGVMEKCTFCVQRIEGAKIAQKVKAGASGDVRLMESQDTVPKTACQQACPANAIVFGDISDPESRVSKLKKQERNYSVLDFLKTKPRTTYLARVRNPNVAMPGGNDAPYTFEEFTAMNGHHAEAGAHLEHHEEAAHSHEGGH